LAARIRATVILYLPDVSCDFSNCPQRSVKLRRDNLRQARWRDSVRPKKKVKIGCHTFRATGITAYLEAGGTLENAQAMAAHESPRTTKLYDRTGDEITLDEVERIAI
jgi:integrase